MFGLLGKPKLDEEIKKALMKGDFDKVRIAMKKNRNLPKSVDDNDSTPLHYVALNKTLQYMKDMDALNKEEIVYYSNTEMDDVREKTPLHSACEKDDLEKVKILISRGVDINVQDQRGRAPIHYAASEGYTDIVRVLVEAGANVMLTNTRGMTAAGEAGHNGHNDLALNLLKIEAQYHRAMAEKESKVVVEDNYVKIAQLLISEKANPNAENKNKRTPLHLACGDGQPVIARLLLDAGAKINAKTRTGRTPLHLASAHGHIDLVELLLERGADINGKDELYVTPLHLACAHGFPMIADLLLKNNADLEARDVHSATPLVYAVNEEQEEVVQLLNKYGAYE